MDRDRYRFDTGAEVDEIKFRALRTDNAKSFKALLDADKADNIDVAQNFARVIFNNIALIDEMLPPVEGEIAAEHRRYGQNIIVRQTLRDEIRKNIEEDNNEEVLKLIRVGELLGLTEVPLLLRVGEYLRDQYLLPPAYRPLRILAGLTAEKPDPNRIRAEFDTLRDEQILRLEVKRKMEEEAAEQWEDVDTSTKSPQWHATISQIERAWRYVSPHLPTGDSYLNQLLRFEAAFGIMQLEIESNPDMNDKESQAMIEHLVRKVWNGKRTKFNDFFSGREWRPGEPSNPRSVRELNDPTKFMFFPRDLWFSVGPLSEDQKKETVRLFRKYSNATHTDKTEGNTDTDKELEDALDIIFRKLVSPFPDYTSSL